MTDGTLGPAIVGFLARWSVFVGVFLALGAVVFRTIVLERARVGSDLIDELGRRAARLGMAGAAIVLASALARLYFQTAGMRFPDEPWMGVASKLVMKSPWGHLWITQVILAAALLWAFRRHIAVGGSWSVVGLLAVATASMPSLTSHAMSGHVSRWITVTADELHVVGAAGWIGTLAVLFFVVLSRRRGDAPPLPIPRIVQAFSPVALAGAATLVTSGVISSVAHLGAIADLVTTAYGRLLLVKVGLVLCVAIYGWRNWRIVTPQLEHPDGARLLRRSAAGELVVACVVLAVTAALIITPPPTSHP